MFENSPLDGASLECLECVCANCESVLYVSLVDQDSTDLLDRTGNAKCLATGGAHVISTEITYS